jgi:transposase InsO family protein
MNALEDRPALVHDIGAAQSAGARLSNACEVCGIDLPTLHRWKADALASPVRRSQAHGDSADACAALTPEERARVLSVANEPRFADRPPARILPALANEGIYIASESIFGRVLSDEGQNAHRGRAKEPKQQRPATTHVANVPGELWRWDMTYSPTDIAGRWFYLYLILDVYNRKIVGWKVHETDDADHAARVVQRAAIAEDITANHTKPVLHGDNGATLKATTALVCSTGPESDLRTPDHW